MTFTYSFQLDQPEHLRATRVIYHRRWSTRATYAFFGVFLFLFPALYLFGGPHVSSDGLILFIATCGAVGALVAAYVAPYWTVRSLRKRNRTAKGPNTYVFSDVGLDARGVGASTSIEWANIIEVHESREFLLFYVSAAWAVLLPKRVIPAAEMTEFKAAVREWLGDRAQGLRHAAER